MITRGRGDDEPTPDVPWPLSRAKLERLTRAGLVERDFIDQTDYDPPLRRFRVEYARP